MFSNSSYPLNLYNKTVTKNRLGANWKFENNDNFIANEYISSNRPPSFNNALNQNENLNISGSKANNFKPRPLKLWRKQRLPNFELNNQKNRKLKNTLLETDLPGGTSISKKNLCTFPNTTCESTKIIPNWKTFIKNKNNLNQIGYYDIINKNCNVICDNKFIGKVIICDPEVNAKKQVLYSSSVNNNPTNLNTPIYYQDFNSYLNSRCKIYPKNFVKDTNNNLISITTCENNQPIGASNSTPYLNCFREPIQNSSCSKQIYKNSNTQFSKNTSVNSSSVIFRKKFNNLRNNNIKNNNQNRQTVYNNGQGISNFDNSVSSSMCNGKKPENTFLFKTRGLTNIHQHGGGAKVNPVKCNFGLYRKIGNFTTACLNDAKGKTIGHMHVNINNNQSNFFGIQKHSNTRKKR